MRYLETRLKQLESLLRTAGVLPQDYINEEHSRQDDEELLDYEDENDSDDDDDDDDEQKTVTPNSSTSSHSETKRNEDSPAPHLSLLKSWLEGEPRYFGTSTDPFQHV